MNAELPTALLIDGRLREGRGETRSVNNPATGVELLNVREASAQDLDDAFDAARRAMPSWAAMPTQERARTLRAASDVVLRDLDRLVAIVVAELGKPVTQARGEVEGAARFFSYTASLLETLTDEIRYTGNPGEEIWTRRRPVGVVAAIIPWNFPSALAARKIAPAVAAGNAIVLKPDEKTPLSALAIAQLLAEAEIFPAGVVNVVTGSGEQVGAAMVSDPRSDLVTMTGSPQAGKEILAAAAASVKPVSLELGGNAPFIVLPDADLTKAIDDAVFSRFMNCGQVCIANERTFVHDSIEEEFVERYVTAVRALVVGDPASESTDVGPKVSAEELEKTERLVATGIAAGGQLRAGGSRLREGAYAAGHWMAPTVVTRVSDDNPLMTDEIFGPVTPVAAFSSFDEVVCRANETRYGLSAYVYTNELATAMRAINELSFGEVYINRPGPEEVNGYHVGYRESGLGGDDGPHGLDVYFRRQTAYVNYR